MKQYGNCLKEVHVISNRGQTQSFSDSQIEIAAFTEEITWTFFEIYFVLPWKRFGFYALAEFIIALDASVIQTKTIHCIWNTLTYQWKLLLPESTPIRCIRRIYCLLPETCGIFCLHGSFVFKWSTPESLRSFSVSQRWRLCDLKRRKREKSKTLVLSNTWGKSNVLSWIRRFVKAK